MNVLVLTNTYAPHVGGVARSVEGFAREYRRRGHRVLVVAPQFPGAPEGEEDVVRVPAIQRFNGSDFSVPMPVPGRLWPLLDRFAPDVVHSHHPFLLGDTALRVAAARQLPVVFTHHTLYERYTHYVPGDSPRLQRFAIDLAVGYCRLCDAVVAPSESVRDLLLERGVDVPVHVVPTGVDVERFAAGDRARGRSAAGIPADAFLVGHVGRLAPEKNLGALTPAVGRFLAARPEAWWLVAGAGPSRAAVEEWLAEAGVADRVRFAGILSPPRLADAYRAMDVFAFASHSETQGMVLTEAMAAGVPVVAVDATGVREAVSDGFNGRLLPDDDEAAFAAALSWIADLPLQRRRGLAAGVAATAERFSMARTASQALELYAALLAARPSGRQLADSLWQRTRRLLAADWDIVRNVAAAAGGGRQGEGA